LLTHVPSDWLVGDNVLRSMYSVYDFGDFDASGKMGDPYVQLLSIVDPNNASAEFAKSRGSTARTGITYTVTPSNTTSAGAPTLSLSANVESILDNVTKYLPAIAAVLGLNALVCIGLLLAATLLLCRRRRSSPPGGVRPRSTLAPRSMAYSTYGGGPEHQYEPVSMAFTDDAGYKYDPEAAAAKRPASAYSSAAPQFTQAYPPPPAHARAASTSAMSYEDPYRPPAPAFRQGGSAGGDRPVSVA
jgi:saccharopepsin